MDILDTRRPQDAPGDTRDAAGPVPLSVMMESGVRFEWHEGVAIVQELCALMSGAGAQSGVLPDPEHVLVRPDGALTLSSRGLQSAESPREQVIALGRLMASLVPDSQMPVKLRLTVLSAISDNAPLATVADLWSGLVRFEPLDRTAVIRSLYSRWRTGPPEPVPAEAPPPRPPTARPVRRPAPARPRNRRVEFAVAALVLITAGAAAVWWFAGRPAVPPTEGITRAASDLASRAWKASQALAASGAATVRSLAGGAPQAPPVAADAAKRPVKSRKAAPPAAARDAKPVEAGDPAAVLPGARAASSPSPHVEVAPIEVLDLAGSLIVRVPAGDAVLPLVPALQPGPARRAGAAAGSGDFAPLVYSSADPDVAPPVLERPMVATVPAVPAADLSTENLCVVDLVISARGEVESVKLVRPLGGARETMMLSAVKAFRFRPALKGTRPVRYVKRMWISLAPTGRADR